MNKKKCLVVLLLTSLLVIWLYASPGLDHVTVDATATRPKCPAFSNKTHPQFVCPPNILARRDPLKPPKNRTFASEYEKWGGPGTFMSQFWEDWFVFSEFFHHQRYIRNGTFVELGGYDGRSGSNSYFFDKTLGWRGLLLEASTPNYVLMEKARLSPRVTTIHGAVCRPPARLLTLWGGQSLTANNREEANNLFHGTEQSVSVCLPMVEYLQMFSEQRQHEKNVPRTSSTSDIEIIDYFSMDVEGQELEIIESHDWTRYPVFVVSIEVAVQPLLSGTAEYQHDKRCALYQRGLCRWPFYDGYVPPMPFDPGSGDHFSLNNEIWINPDLLVPTSNSEGE